MANQSDRESFLCSQLVKVLYEDESCQTHSAIANLEEISASSATLLSDDLPEPWRPIAFSAKGHDLYGIVESVDIDEMLGCFIKIKLDPLCRWQETSFVPDHFFAPSPPTSDASSNGLRAIAKAFALEAS